MENLKDYMYKNDLSEEDVIRTLKYMSGFINKNNFYFEISGNEAYIESVGDKSIKITKCDLKKGHIKIEIEETQ